MRVVRNRHVNEMFNLQHPQKPLLNDSDGELGSEEAKRWHPHPPSSDLIYPFLLVQYPHKGRDRQKPVGCTSKTSLSLDQFILAIEAMCG